MGHPKESDGAGDGAGEQEKGLREKSSLRGDPLVLYSCLEGGGGQVGGARSLVLDDGMRGNGLELCPGRFRLDTRKNPSAQRAGGRWDRLPGEGAASPPRGGVKRRADVMLRDGVWGGELVGSA